MDHVSNKLAEVGPAPRVTGTLGFFADFELKPTVEIFVTLI